MREPTAATGVRGVVDRGQGTLRSCYPIDVRIALSLAVATLATPALAGPIVLDPNNHPPEWDTATPSDVTGSDQQAISFMVRASDADNDPLTYSLSGLPVGARAEASDGAVQVKWKPTSDDVGVYRVVATVTDGKTKVDKSIKIVVAEEHESFFMPGVGYSLWVPGNVDRLGVFNGFAIEFLGIRWVHDNEKRGPSHGSIYLDFDVLFSTGATKPDPVFGLAVDPAFMPVIGLDLSIERNPARRFLIPYFGLEGGALFQQQTGTLGLMLPFAGLHVYSSRNVEVGARAGYMLPFTSEQFGDLAGLRARLTVDVSYW
jgi:hypothetical protein